MRTKAGFIFIAVCSTILTACQASPVVVPTVTTAPTITSVPPTNTQIPTNTPVPTHTVLPTETSAPTATASPLPTETAKPTTTALPEGVLFRDDFEGQLQPGWEWENENPANWIITDDGWLQIIGEGLALLGGEKQSNLLWYPLPSGDFAITVHLDAKPFENFHQATIYLYEDPENYVAINRGFCGPCVPGGGGFYMEYKISGDWGTYKVATDVSDVYLKLESVGNVISGYYATEPGQWQRLGRFGNYFQFKKVGIGVSNVHAANVLVGLYDYFEISLP